MSEGFAKRIGAKLRALIDRHLTGIVLTTLVVTMVSALMYPMVARTIPAGHVGVMFRRFGDGTDVNLVLGEGIQLKWPWDRIEIYDTRLTLMEDVFAVLSSDGLQIQVETAIRYWVDPKTVPWLHKLVGPDYTKTLIRNEIGSRLRSVLSRYRPEEIYALRRTDLEHEIAEKVALRIESQLSKGAPMGLGINVDDVRIRAITLPESISQAIQRKKEQQQLAEEYVYRIEREKLEADRKRIEAEGIRDFQNVVKSGISEPYLRWKGLEASAKLAESNNTKIIIFGSPKTGMPLILGDLEANEQRPETPPPSPP